MGSKKINIEPGLSKKDIYYNFIRKNGRFPTPDEASVIGKLLNKRVRASDNVFYPTLDSSKKQARKEIKQRRIEFREKAIRTELLTNFLRCAAELRQFTSESDLETLRSKLASVDLPFVIEWLLQVTNHAGNLDVKIEDSQNHRHSPSTSCIARRQAANDP